jgi:hypothetical protein
MDDDRRMNSQQLRYSRPSRRTAEPMDYVARRFVSLIVLASAALAGLTALAAEGFGLSTDFAKATAVVVFAVSMAIGTSLAFELHERRLAERAVPVDESDRADRYG